MASFSAIKIIASSRAQEQRAHRKIRDFVYLSPKSVLGVVPASMERASGAHIPRWSSRSVFFGVSSKHEAAIILRGEGGFSLVQGEVVARVGVRQRPRQRFLGQYSSHRMTPPVHGRNYRCRIGGRQRQVPRLVQCTELFLRDALQRGDSAINAVVAVAGVLEGQDVADPGIRPAGLADREPVLWYQLGEFFHHEIKLTGNVLEQPISRFAGPVLGLLFQADHLEDLPSLLGSLLLLDDILDGGSRLDARHHVPDGESHRVGICQQPIIRHEVRDGPGRLRGPRLHQQPLAFLVLFLRGKWADLLDDFWSRVAAVS
mmetsp:Transcript_15883/g.36765  ORF Transcript_15883/g.36765 Transcript_15883/m.36765 type:complete len:316 (+) Transcript_15883:198-1145(+)